MPASVFITGASRGIGHALAVEFANRGYRLALTARQSGDLAALQQQLEPAAAAICTRQLDVTDGDSIGPVLQDCATELGGIDIVVANAGIAINARAGKGQLAQMQQVIDTNLGGAIATCEAAVELFRQGDGGQLVGITSIAGLRGMRGLGAYSASKAGFSKYLEAVRCETLREPISVTELAPGYIDTDLNRDVANRPFVVSADKGARIMVDLIERRVASRYVPPWPWTLLAPLLKVLPTSVLAKM